VVGLSPKPYRDSHRVARYLVERGYQVFPVYPREASILERPVFRRVQDIPGGVDLVNVFRRSEELGPVFDDALAAKARAIWTQYDCVDVESAQRAQQAGVLVVMDRCLMVEHRRLVRD
jgi:predicted CoA-binding protein